MRALSASKRARRPFVHPEDMSSPALSLDSTKAEFDAFLFETFGITNNKLSVEQAKSEAVSGGNGWGDLCEAWGEAPRDLVTLRVKANSHTSSVMVSTGEERHRGARGQRRRPGDCSMTRCAVIKKPRWGVLICWSAA